MIQFLPGSVLVAVFWVGRFQQALSGWCQGHGICRHWKFTLSRCSFSVQVFVRRSKGQAADCKGRIGRVVVRNALPTGGSRRVSNPALQRSPVGVPVRFETVRFNLCGDCSR